MSCRRLPPPPPLATGTELLNPFPPCRDAFFSCSQSATGYSGTATYVRTAVALPFASEEGFTGCAALAAAMAGTTGVQHSHALGDSSVSQCMIVGQQVVESERA